MSTHARARGAMIGTTAFAMLLLSAVTFAGGSAENAMLIIDPTDPISMYVGNYYKNARNIPDANVVYMRSAATSYNSFTSTVQAGFLGSLTQRNILDHIDYVVLAPLNSYSLPAPSAFVGIQNVSITAAYEIVPMSSWKNPNPSQSNPYGASATSAYPSGDPAVAFHSQQTYLNGSPSTSGFAGNLYISAVLGYTQGPVGNSVPQLLSMIDRSTAVDGTRPTGTFYFMNNLADSVRNIRACNGCGSNPYIYAATASEITALHGSATVVNGIVPNTGTTNIMGIMSGFANYNIASANLTLVPGAFADHLTSFAGVLDGTQGQTTVQSWIAAGASGSAGSVEEPGANVSKFPSPDLHYYYYQGMSLGESYLHSVEALPFEMLLYGDPLTRPFAYLPSVSVSAASGVQSGVITITPSATTMNPGAAIASFTLLVDGVNMGSANPGQSFSLDTQLLNDGRHDLRVLASDNTAVQNVGRWIGVLDTFNYGHASTLSVSPASGTLVQPFSFSYSATGGNVREVHLVQNGRVLASSTTSNGTLTVYGQNLGAGNSTVKLEVWYDDARIGWSVPVSVSVTSSGTPAGVTPVAYSYSKYLTAPTAYVVELPASYDIAPGSATYTVLNTPTQSTVVQSNAGGPYIIVQPQSGAVGTDTLQFSVKGNNVTSNTATVTLVYTSVTTIAGVPSSTWASGRAWNNNREVGLQIINGNNRAGMWVGTADSWSDLTPAGAFSSEAYAANGGQIVGSAGINGASHGGYWTTNAASWVDLTPPGTTDTRGAGVYVNAADGLAQGQQVGYAYEPADGKNHALLWKGTAASVVDVSPLGANSGLMGTNGVYQVGFTTAGNTYHTGFWNGTASSWVDVNPAGATESFPSAMDDNTPYESVGYATFNGAVHAGYWVSANSTNAGTWVDLNPSGASESKAINADANRQVGYGMMGGVAHAGMWNGTATSWIDLSQYLPAAYSGYSSHATAIRHDANGIYILGDASTANGTTAVTWTLP